MANPNPSPATRLSNAQDHCDPEDKLSPLAQLRRLQRVLFRAATTDQVDNREAAQLALAWERLEERKRVLTMRPAPKPIDVQPRKPRQSRQQSHAGPVDPATGQALGPG